MAAVEWSDCPLPNPECGPRDCTLRHDDETSEWPHRSEVSRFRCAGSSARITLRLRIVCRYVCRHRPAAIRKDEPTLCKMKQFGFVRLSGSLCLLDALLSVLPALVVGKHGRVTRQDRSPRLDEQF